MADGKNPMKERKIKMFVFKTLNLKLNSEVQAGNTKPVRTRTSHKGNSNALNMKKQPGSSWSPTAQLPQWAHPDF